MIIQDAGHVFLLKVLDSDTPGAVIMLPYVKRVGPKYPGNAFAHAGTTLQEGWRAEIYRLKYVNAQKPCDENPRCIERLRENILDLELRAAREHGRILAGYKWPNIEDEETCTECGHIQCDGGCRGIHPKNA